MAPPEALILEREHMVNVDRSTFNSTNFSSVIDTADCCAEVWLKKMQSRMSIVDPYVSIDTAPPRAPLIVMFLS